MATITTDTFLDGGVARTAGEAWTCNGGRLTIRTDSRWHANSPAGMLGSLGALTISSTLGGGYTIDGRNVRWMPYDTGSGNVPAVGTSITQGGVSGYLLGVWASLTAAPTAVGAAMPASGFIKFREVTSGPFAAGALTGIGASATGPDVVGWIEVVHDTSVAITVPRLGDFTVRGDWFDLGTTTGAANQLVQIPTNGSATAYVPGVWIANTDTPLTDYDWEFYPAIYAGALITTNFETDLRSLVVCMETNGNIRIGHNGTTAVGYVPPVGRKIRIPNVIGRQCLAASRNVNVLPSSTFSTRPDFTTTSAGAIDIEYFTTDWYMNFAQPFSVKLHHSAMFESLTMSEVASPLDIYDGGNGLSQALSASAFDVVSCFAGGDIEKWYAIRQSAINNGHAFLLSASIGQTLTNVQSGVATYARNTGGRSYNFVNSSGITTVGCRQFNNGTTLTTCSDVTITNLDHVDRYAGTTNTTAGVYAVAVATKCSNILVDGITFGLGGTIANCHPYNGLMTSTLSDDVTLRNVGTRSAIIAGGTNPPLFIFVSGGNNQRIKLQRIYLQPTGTGAFSTVNSDKGNVYEHVYGDFADTMTLASLNTKVKNCGGTNTVTGQSSVYGTMFWDAFTSDTVGRLVLQMNEATAETAAYQTLVAGTPKFTSAGTLVLDNVGDEVQWEMDYWCLGSTALANAAPVVTGTNVTFSSGARWGNHDLYYQIDKGAGFGGTWIALNQTNLALETGINPAIGFKLKIRAVCAIASTTNLLTYIRITTVSTLADQSANLYPLDTSTLTLTGLKVNSEVRVFEAGTQTEVAGIENSGTSAAFEITVSEVDIVVLALQYENIRIAGISTVSDITVPIQQAFDRNYANA